MHCNGSARAVSGDENACFCVALSAALVLFGQTGGPGTLEDRIGRLYRGDCCVGVEGYDGVEPEGGGRGGLQ